MARYREPVCRLCRREGIKLFLKGERCFREKCAIEKRNFIPGQHGKDRRGRHLGHFILLLFAPERHLQSTLGPVDVSPRSSSTAGRSS